MAKKKNGKGKSNPQAALQGQISRMQQQMQAMVSARAGSGQSKSAKRKARKRARAAASGTGKARTPRFNLDSLSPFARGMLDPFRAKGVRVPDTVFVETMTTTTRSWCTAAGNTPIMNYSTQMGYGTVIFAPLAGTATYKNLHVSFAKDGNSKFFDNTGNATPSTVDFTKGH